MQLDLFVDNRRIILGNLADEHLRDLELDEAAGIYDRILAEWPDDSAIAAARRALDVWRERIQRFHSSPGGIDGMHALYANLAEPAPSSLRSGVRSFIIVFNSNPPLNCYSSCPAFTWAASCWKRAGLPRLRHGSPLPWIPGYPGRDASWPILVTPCS